MAGTFVSALSVTSRQTIIAGCHHFGIARSDDIGASWQWANKGITQFDVWVVKAERIGDRDLVLAGTMPAHLFVSADNGKTWTHCPGLRAVETADNWFFPPPPHLGHVKDIVVHRGEELIVGIEVGALLRSRDAGQNFEEIPVCEDFTDIDVHRVVVHPDRPDRYIVANGWGLMLSEDRGKTWVRLDAAGINYPDAMVTHPHNPDLLFLSGAVGYPPNWYAINRARPRLARSKDGGMSWERLLGGFPSGQRAAIGGMTLAVWEGGSTIFVGDTDGQIFESRDGGDSWSMIFETGAVSKGEHYRGLMKGRPPMADLDSLTFAPAGQKRIDTAKA